MELSFNTTNEGVDWVCTLLASTNYTNEIRIAKYTEPDLSGLAQRDVIPSCFSSRNTSLRAERSGATQSGPSKLPDRKQPGITQQSWTFTICLYLPDDVRADARSSELVNLLSPLQRTGLSTAVETAVVEEKVAPVSPLVRRIGQRFVVLSPDAPYHSTADEVTLRLKTTLAFGSGLHPATELSLQMLERYIVPAMNVLDLGSGSGILSVAMAKLGASVLALDNDSIAVQSTQDAVHRNSVEQQVTVVEGSLGYGSVLGHWMGGDALNNVHIKPAASFDLIVANILARIHIALAPDFRRALRQTDARAGLLITAGFTTDYEDAVAMSLKEEGFEVVDCEQLNGWVALAHRLK